MIGRKHIGTALLCGLLASTALTACSSSATDDAAKGQVTLNYWLWDDNQLASYQSCADAFHTANPNINVKITQTAWAQYWTNLTTQLAAGQAPDVWTDQTSYYPQFVSSQQILDIQPYVDADKVDLNQYQDGLAACGPRTASGTGYRRTGTPRRSSTTATCSPSRASSPPTWPTSAGTPPTAGRLSRPSPSSPSTSRVTTAWTRRSTRTTSRSTATCPSGTTVPRARTDGVNWPQPTASPTWTRTRGAPSSSTTTPSSCRPSAGTSR